MVPDNQNEGLPPVSLPAGSYDAAELFKALDTASAETDPDKRDDAISDALDKVNETDFTDSEIMPGYKPVDVETVIDGETIVEAVLVYHPDADAPVPPADADVAPAAPAAPGGVAVATAPASITPPAPAVQPADPDAPASGDHEE